MLHALKERKRAMRSEPKRMYPTLHDTVLLALPGPPLSICLLHTILAGGHFPPKINDTFALPSI